MNEDDTNASDPNQLLWEKLVKAAHHLKKAMRYNGSWDTHDFAQQAVANIIGRNPGLIGSASPEELGGLLWTVVQHAIADRMRADGRIKRPPKNAADAHADPPDPTMDLEDAAARRELLEIVETHLVALETGTGVGLSSERRKMLAHTFRRAINGDTHAEIANDLKVDRATVTHRLQFVLAFLREGLGKGGTYG